MLDLDTAIQHCLEVAEQNETQADKIGRQFIGSAMDKRATDCRECASDHRQLAEWLTELKDLREENKVLISECDRLIKEKGELLSKVSGGDVLRICQLEEQLEKAKRFLKAAVDDVYNSVNDVHCKYCSKWHTDQCQGTSHLDCYLENKFKWQHEAEALALIGGSENA